MNDQGQHHRGPFASAVAPRLSVALLCAALVSLAMVARAADGDSAPLLRIETGMHSGMITALASDRGGAVLLTASLDGTARLWDTRSGALLRTLRPPIEGEPGEGRLFAASLSADGKLAAVAGYTRYFDFSSGRGSSLYLFDAQTGALRRRIAGLASPTGHPQADAVRDLRLFADPEKPAQLLLAAARTEGTASLSIVESGLQRGADLQGSTLDVDERGRLVLLGPGREVRLLDSRGPALVKRPIPMGSLPEGLRPLQARLSPDGGKLAILVDGGGEAPGRARVLVWSAPTLSPLYEVALGDTSAVAALAWLPAGPRLCIGGEAGEGRPLLRCYDDGGRGPARDLTTQVSRDQGATGAVRALLPLPGGALAYATEEPAFGVLEADGRRRLQRRAAFTDLARLPPAERAAALRIDARGASVGWPGAGHGQRFDVLRGQLSQVRGPQDPALLPPLLVAPGKPQRPPQGQHQGPPLALCYRPDGDGYLAGWDNRLVGFNRDGLQRFSAPLPAPLRALTISGDSNIAVAALGDGTLRWYRVRSGEELLALFVAPDGRRFVAFTPGGAYDASVDGESLAGWHLNPLGPQEARFVPVALLRKTFYRPSRVAAALDLGPTVTDPIPRGDDPRGPAPPDARRQGALLPLLPPRVTLATDAPAVQRVGQELRFQVSVSQSDATLRFLINGRAAREAQVVAARGQDPNLRVVRLPIAGAAQPLSLTVLAESRAGASEPLDIPLPAVTAPIPEEERPRLWLLAVGVSRYARPALAMTPGLAASDATDLAKLLDAQKGALYREVKVRVLTDAQATRDQVLDGLEWLARVASARDVVVVQLAGHGVNDPESGQYYFLPHDADPEHLLRTAVAGPTLQSALAAVPGRVLLLLDTCHAGNAMARGSGDFTRFVNELSGAERGVVVMTSALGRQLAQESPQWGHGAFTLALLEALRGKADYRRSGRITLAALDLYVSERVRELTAGAQTPVLARPITVPDFALVQLP